MLTVNLYDSNFTQSFCSVAFQEPQHIAYVRGLEEFDGITLFTDEWINNPIVDQVSSKHKIGWLREPCCLHPFTYRKAVTNVHKFDFILTYYKPFLDLWPDRFRFAPYGGTWLSRYDWGLWPKTKFCSMLIGNKMSTEGHRIRHEIADTLQGVDFYGVLGQPTDYSQQTKLMTLADYQFSIVTETCREDNLFTEWLLDCFAVGTVPIYWGAPNIGDFFNIEGIIPFANLEEFLRKFPPSTDKYNKDAMEDNLSRMAGYAITEDWLYLNVLEKLE